MKRIVFGILLLLCVPAIAKINTIVSIAPQKGMVEMIGGELVHVTLMVPSGSSPHSYEPKPSQMNDVNNAELYFSIGVEFEEAWIGRFSNQNKSMKIIDVASGIEKIEMVEHAKDEGHDHDHDHEGADPHVWTAPSNIKIIGKNIYESLIQTDPKNSAIYAKNYEAFLIKVEELENRLKEILKDIPPETKFMVFHPSWGYFAKEYNFIQWALEVEGKEPKPKTLTKIIKEAKENRVKVIFAQPEFSDKSTRLIAEELSIEVIKISPLSEDWYGSLIDLAEGIAKSNH